MKNVFGYEIILLSKYYLKVQFILCTYPETNIILKLGLGRNPILTDTIRLNYNNET